MSNQNENAQNQIKKAFDLISWYDQSYLEHILYPDRVIQVNIPIKMDSWKIKNFIWYRSQHNNARWPYKWWIRFHETVAYDEVVALSIWMSIKTALVWIPLWGWKWWVVVNSKELSDTELENLSRWYVRKLFRYLWPNFDVPAPDVWTWPKVMAWMMDEYSKISLDSSNWSFTWKPLPVWGSFWRDTATSRWWFFVLQKYIQEQWWSLAGKKVSIQWAWNAWMNIMSYLDESWAKLVAISDSKWWVYSDQWLDVSTIKCIKENWDSVIDYDAKNISNNDLLELDVDILILAAMENQVTVDNADNIKANLLLELANGPVNPQADDILYDKSIVVIPDVLANAGGVVVSYFEQIQNNTNNYWTEEEIDNKLKTIMYDALSNVLEKSNKINWNFRTSWYVLAIERILENMDFRWVV